MVKKKKRERENSTSLPFNIFGKYIPNVLLLNEIIIFNLSNSIKNFHINNKD